MFPAYALAGLGVLVLAVSIALSMLLPVFLFPHPSGPFGIGTLTYDWVDLDRPEIFSSDPKARHELMVQTWYPAREDASSPRAPYLADADAVTTAFCTHTREAGVHVRALQVRHHKRRFVRARRSQRAQRPCARWGAGASIVHGVAPTVTLNRRVFGPHITMITPAADAMTRPPIRISKCEP